MNFFVFYSIISVVFGRLTGTVTTVEHARMPEKNETKAFTVQYGPNQCIPENRRNILMKSTIIGKVSVMDDDDEDTMWVDTHESEMTVNVKSDPFGNYNIAREEFYVGFINCAGSFSYNCRDGDTTKCDWYVPVINGGICNHETGERYSGKLTFAYSSWCAGSIIKTYKKWSDCYHEIGICY